jgi:hypothetical protein
VRDRADRGHQAERDRQAVVAAFLREVGRGEVDGDAAGRQSDAGGDQGRPHPLARFRNRLIGKADNGEGRHARRNLHLDVDRAHLDALERNGSDALDHPQSRTQIRAKPHGQRANPAVIGGVGLLQP